MPLCYSLPCVAILFTLTGFAASLPELPCAKPGISTALPQESDLRNIVQSLQLNPYDQLGALLTTSIKNKDTSTVEDILLQFKNLPRNREEEASLIHLKYQMILWRDLMKTELIGSLQNAKEASVILKKLSMLGKTLNANEAKSLSKKLPLLAENKKLKQDLLLLIAEHSSPKTISEVLEDKNSPLSPENRAFLLAKSGPLAQLDFPSTAPTKYGTSGWINQIDNSAYQKENGEYLYRGVRLRAGDVFLTDLNIPASGLFSTFIGKGGYAAHAGVFVVLKKDGKDVPAVLEMHEAGVRAVPLSSYVDSYKSNYLEVVRPVKAPDQNKLEKLAEQAFKDNFYKYDFTMKSPRELKDKAQTCPTIVDALNAEAGGKRVETLSSFSEGTKKNLRKLGVSAEDTLTPSDFLFSENYQFQGVIDNADAPTQWAARLPMQKIGDLFQNSELKLDKLPDTFERDADGIKEIQDNSWLGAAYGYFFGLDKKHFPEGDPKIISFVKTISESSTSANEKSQEGLVKQIRAKMKAGDPLSIEEMGKDPATDKKVNSALGEVPGWF